MNPKRWNIQIHVVIWTTCFLLATATASAQSSARPQEMRTWTSRTGSQITARLIDADRESVRLETEDDRQLEVAIADLAEPDVRMVERYFEKQYLRTLKSSRDQILATEALQTLEKFQSQARLSSETAAELSRQISELTDLASKDAIQVESQRFIPRSELDRHRVKASELIDKWIALGAVADESLLREAIQEEPFGLESAVMYALFLEVHKRDGNLAQRHLSDSVRRGEKFIELLSDSDRANLSAAINNLGVSLARDNQIAKSIKTFRKAIEIEGIKAPACIGHNVAKLNRMASGEFGLGVKRSQLREVSQLAFDVGGVGDIGGWRWMNPTDATGKARTNLDILANSEFATLSETGEIEDTRCVRCDGEAEINCPHKLCRNGGVETNNYVRERYQRIDGEFDVRIRLVRKVVKCDTCAGHGKIACPFCNAGHQESPGAR